MQPSTNSLIEFGLAAAGASTLTFSKKKMRHSKSLIFFGLSLFISSCDSKRSTKDTVMDATIATREAPAPSKNISDNDKRLQSFRQYLDEMKKQVEACWVSGGLADEFQAFLESKGIRSHSQGGDESHLITVHEDDLDRFLTVADHKNVIERYGLSIRHQESNTENKNR